MTEDVWEYPRPPALVPCARRVRVVHGGETVADSTAALRILETSHPPTIYVPPADVRAEHLRPVPGKRSFCEWKGWAVYFDVGDARAAAWSYPDPVAAYAELKDHVAFYPGRMDGCFLDDEQVRAQEGDFYGGWVTSDITGAMKGGPGTRGW